MKTIFTLAITLTILLGNINCQELMKIGEVFDFEINDEFHTSGNAPDQPPNADRQTIIDKYYSINSDTVYYVIAHDSYQTIVEWEPEPHLEYSFNIDTTTVYYTNLDSSLYYFYEGFQYDTNIYYATDYCDSLVNECEFAIGEFEPDYFRKSFAKGLGLVYSFQYSGSAPGVQFDRRMFYYNKNGNECGVPDLTTVGIKNNSFELNNYEVYPNPVKSMLYIKNLSGDENFKIRLINSQGQLIKAKALMGNINMIDIKDIPKGILCLEIIRKDKIERLKILKR